MPLPPELGFRAVFVVNVVFIATLLVVLTRNFRRAGPFGRRQLKWVVLGIYVGTVPVLLTDVVTAVAPPLWWLHEVAVIAEIFIPLCVLIAIVRANYFDVDQLITGMAVYSLLSILLLAAVLTVVPQLARSPARRSNLDPNTGQLVLSVVVAAGLVPGHRFFRPRVERVLFRERHALREGRRGTAARAVDGRRTRGAAHARRRAPRRRSCGRRPASSTRRSASAFTPVFARGTERRGGPPRLAGRRRGHRRPAVAQRAARHRAVDVGTRQHAAEPRRAGGARASARRAAAAGAPRRRARGGDLPRLQALGRRLHRHRPRAARRPSPTSCPASCCASTTRRSSGRSAPWVRRCAATCRSRSRRG